MKLEGILGVGGNFDIVLGMVKKLGTKGFDDEELKGFGDGLGCSVVGVLGKVKLG